MSAPDPDVKTVFGRALEIASPAERTTYLNQACGENAALRSDVEELLAAAERAGSFLNRPAADPNVIASTVLTNPLSERAGTVIGPYKLLQQIGEGGFGVVYMAEQEKPVRRTVALKIIKPGMDTREVIARFEAERQALALMDHQNIARVLDAGATDSGRPYFVMELVKGIPITEYCNHNRLTPRERLELFVPVCNAIQHAHQKGIIHRDIKPSNVLVCLYDGKPVPKVIDFGVAKAIEQRLTEKTMFTRHGQVVGTLEYMSPEQAELSQLDIDTRSDVYSLGVLLYELLTGTTPITKDQLRQAGFTEMLRMIRETEPDRPSLRLSHSHETLATISAQRRTEPAKLGAILKGELDWLVMKALEKDRTRRYETANGLARDIERYLHDEAVEACPPSVGYRLSKLVRRHRRSVVLGGIIAGLMLALMVNFFVSYFRLKAARQHATAEAEHARMAEAEALSSLDVARVQQQRAEEAERAAQRDRDRALAAEQTTAEQRDRAVAAEQDAVQQRELEAESREQALDSLARSQLEQARAVRLASLPGRRWEVLELLKQSEALRSRTRSNHSEGEVSLESASTLLASLPAQAELRTEAVAALLTADGRVAKHLAGFAHSVSPDGRFVASVSIDHELQSGGLTVTDLKAGKIVHEWNGKQAEAMSGVMIALGPDSEKLAVLSLNMQDIKLWQLRDKKLLRTLKVPESAAKAETNAVDKPAKSQQLSTLRPVRNIVFSPNGHYLAGMVSQDPGGTAILLWKVDEPDEGQTIASVRGIPIMTAVFSPDSRRIAFPSGSKKVSVWDIGEQRTVTEIELPLRTDAALGFHPAGDRLGVHCQEADSKSKLLLWDIAQNREVARIDTGASGSITPVSFSPDGDRVAVAGSTGALVVLDLASTRRTGEKPPMRLDHGSMVQSLAWSADGVLLTGGLGGLKQWEFSAAEALSALRLDYDEKPGMLGRVAFSPDGHVVAAMPWHGGEVMAFERQTGKKQRSWRNGLSYETAVDLRYSPDGQLLVKFGFKGVVAWDATSGEEKLRLATEAAGFSTTTSIGFRTDGSVLVAGIQGGKPRVREVATGKSVWAPSSKSLPSLAAVSPNGRFALTYRAFALGGDLSIPVWDLETNQQRFTLPGPEGQSYQSLAEISPDSRWILALHYGGEITKSFSRGAPETRPIGEATSAAAGFVPPMRSTFGTAVPIAPDQEWIGEVWNSETGQRHCQIDGPSTVEYYVFSPNGRYLAISMRNGAIRLWDVHAGQELFDWRPTSGRAETPFSPRHLAFTADSSTLAVPDPSSPVLHLLDLTRINQQLAEVSLDW